MTDPLNGSAPATRTGSPTHDEMQKGNELPHSSGHAPDIGSTPSSDPADLQRRLADMVASSEDAIITKDVRGSVMSWNWGAERLYGYRPDEIIGRHMSVLIPEHRSGEERNLLDTIMAGGRVDHYETERLRKDGTIVDVSVTISPIRESDGSVVGASSIARDVTERKELERTLISNAAQYRGLLEAAPDAMVVVNAEGAIELLNVRAEKEFGYSRDELLGNEITSIIPEGFGERLVSDALRSEEEALAQQIGTGIELTGRRKNGTEFPIEIMLSPLEGPTGLLVTAAIRDITARTQAADALLLTVAELEESNQELQQFAYVASHDLQEPLRMVASYLQLLERRYAGQLDADADEFIGFAVDGATRMQRLIQDLLTYSRVGSTGGDMMPTRSADSLADAISNLQGAILDSGAEISSGVMPVVLADQTQLTQLFQNLIANAIKYRGSEKPVVNVSALPGPDGEWIMSVRDNGLGIDAQYFDRIFGMFQRLHKRGEFEGTGIGLAICKKIVARHHGEITVESEPGTGSTFHVSLPAATIQRETIEEMV